LLKQLVRVVTTQTLRVKEDLAKIGVKHRVKAGIVVLN
jgi:hypothetical protein